MGVRWIDGAANPSLSGQGSSKESPCCCFFFCFFFLRGGKRRTLHTLWLCVGAVLYIGVRGPGAVGMRLLAWHAQQLVHANAECPKMKTSRPVKRSQRTRQPTVHGMLMRAFPTVRELEEWSDSLRHPPKWAYLQKHTIFINRGNQLCAGNPGLSHRGRKRLPYIGGVEQNAQTPSRQSVDTVVQPVDLELKGSVKIARNSHDGPSARLYPKHRAITVAAVLSCLPG